MYYYRELNRAEVNPDERILAELVAEVSAVKLKIDPPEIRFITECMSGPISRHIAIDGLVRGIEPRKALVRAHQPISRLVEVTAHESEHCRQFANEKRLNPEFDERRADLFSRLFYLRKDISYRDALLDLAELGARFCIERGSDHFAKAENYIQLLEGRRPKAAADLESEITQLARDEQKIMELRVAEYKKLIRRHSAEYLKRLNPRGRPLHWPSNIEFR